MFHKYIMGINPRAMLLASPTLAKTIPILLAEFKLKILKKKKRSSRLPPISSKSRSPKTIFAVHHLKLDWQKKSDI